MSDSKRKTSEKSKGTKKNSIIAIIIILIGLIVISWLIYSYLSSGRTENSFTETVDSLKLKEAEQKKQNEFLKAATAKNDTGQHVIRVSEPEGFNVPYGIDHSAGNSVKRVFTGRRINIAVTGLDNRLGTRSNHADANHVLSILVDSGVIEITSIPRDTPADAELPDSSGQNKLTIVRAVRGREAYHKELADIAGLDKIHYYIEAGFSQTMGILELFGIKDSKSALQVLRSRTGLGGDDYQRCYNQGQFIRQMVLKNFKNLNGILGEILIRGGLALVETNLTADILKNIIAKLNAKGFPRTSDDMFIRVRPTLGMNFKIYDFNDENVFQSLRKKIERFNESRSDTDSAKIVVNVERKLFYTLSIATKDTAKRPDNVIRLLSIYFDQHAWLQVLNLRQRDSIREMFATLLIHAYNKKKQFAKAQTIRNIVDSEKKMLSNPLK